MIEVQALRKSFGSLVAVDGVSFTIQPGETFGLLGPNGAGKTTTIHMLVGVLTPDAGDVKIDGASDPTRADVRRRIGIAPQKASLYENLSAAENLEFFGRLYGLAGAKLAERVAWGLAFAGLAERKHSRVKTFSGGMQRRLNLACGLVHDPPVIFLDEPTAGVDPQSRNHLFEAIEALRKDGRTILYTTHYMEEAQRLCDRVAVMDHGRLLALDSVAALIRQHGGHSVVTAEMLDGTSQRFESAKPLEEIGRLALGQVRSLHVDQPNLESVFLSLTGRSLRD